MGYTNYAYVNLDTPPELLVEAHSNIAKVVEASTVPLASWDGEPGTKPIIEEGTIRFNGVGEDSHETFVWPPDMKPMPWYPDKPEAFMFVKTAAKPYDQTVVACYLAAKKALGDHIRLSSDGDLNEYLYGAGMSGPESAHDLYVRVFDEEPPVPWTDEEE